MARTSFRPQRFDTAKTAPATPSVEAGISRRSLILAVVGAGGFASLASASMLVFQRTSAAEPAMPVDRATGCRATGPAPATTVMLVDNSEPLTNVHVARARRLGNDELNRLPNQGQFIVTTMNAAKPNDPPVRVLGCSPGPADTSGGLFRGRVHAARTFDAQFAVPARTALEEFLEVTGQTVSPIAETIAAVSRIPEFDAGVPNRRLVIVSDLLQNDRLPARPDRRSQQRQRPRGYTHYERHDDLWAAYLRSPIGQRLRPDLTGVSVVIEYLDRPDATEFQNAAHRTFWTRWFREAGAVSVEYRGIGRERVATR